MQQKWDELESRAKNYFKMCELAIASKDQTLIQNALENMHLALELIMKSMIAKNGGNYPDFGRKGHDLETLMLCKFQDQNTSILVLAKKQSVHSLFNIGLSSWSMDCRYILMENYDDMKASIEDYKELYRWISNQLLK